MPIFFPRLIGGVISGSDSDSISTELSVDQLTVGSKIWNVDVGSYFTLTISTASLVTDQILAVLGYDGLRWIIESSGVTVNSVTGQTANSVNNSDPSNPVLKDATEVNAGTMSSSDKAKIDKIVIIPKAGSDLTDADATVQPFNDHAGRYLLRGPLTGNRVLTVGNTNVDVSLTYVLNIVVFDTSAFTYTIKNASGSTLFTHESASVPVSYTIVKLAGSSDWVVSGVAYTDVV